MTARGDTDPALASAVVETAAALVVVMDTDGCIVEWNPASARLTGYPAKEVVGRHLWDVVQAPDQAGAARDELKRLVESPGTVERDIRWITKDGRRRLMAWSTTVVVDSAGVPEHVIGIGVDVTDQRRLRERVERMLEKMPVAFFSLDSDFRFTRLNRRAVELLGKPSPVLMGERIWEALPEIRSTTLTEALQESMRERAPLQLEFFYSPTSAWLDIQVDPFDEGVSVYLRDVTEWKQREDDLQQAQTRYRNLVERMPAITYTCEVGEVGEWLYVSPQIESMLGYTPDEWRANSELWLERIHPADRERALQDEARATLDGGPLLSEYRMIARDGRVRWFRDEAVIATGADGDLVFEGLMLDITERKRAEEQLQHLADHDPLTGLLNRQRFDSELNRELARAARYGGGGAVLMLDLDNFKYVNDTLGHAVGDEVLRKVSALLVSRLRKTDIVARLGGDEFALLLPQVDEARARQVADDVLVGVTAEPLAIGGQVVRMTTSIGIALFNGRDISGQELMLEADLAMYEAKEAGRDRVRLYSSGTQERVGERLRWADRVRWALDNDGFELYAQPVLDLATNEVTQYELLLRMRTSDGEMVPPGAFIPPAERFGLIPAIDRWVIARAAGIVAEHSREGRNIRFEVNLSAASFGDPELSAYIEAELRSSGAPPENLIFEITETAAIANLDEARDFARRLAALGCLFALDDFGAGFGSFYYLKYLPLDFLKIDGDFIQDLAGSFSDQLMVKAMVQVAHGLGLKTIAEFVGDDDTLTFLRRYEVDYAQGFHVGHPGPLAEVLGAGEAPAATI